ncbi:PEP-CTERM sorting domain-containing protein [Rippkaea orientalis]|uniref:PEP-CTERM sorting domain-containing protein n=1 Tax=Rippkaea orientalis TaxID=2546366 RepID=UPI003B984B9F
MDQAAIFQSHKKEGKFKVNDSPLTTHSSLPFSNHLAGVVPEPLTILGAGTAIGFGATFKRKLAKKTNKK